MSRQTRTEQARNRHNTIALVYDFDGTLSPQPMQEYTVLPKLGLSAKKFWAKVKDDVRLNGGDEMLTYMRLLVTEIEKRDQHINRRDLKALATGIQFFPGVESWFDRINRYVRKRSNGRVRVRHYIISAGLKEILEGISIRKHFSGVFASEYYFNQHDMATFPKVLINDTAKTQYIFRINKGREDSRESINDYMPETQRPIPFSNIIYLGDGMTDVPCMTVTKKNGGYAVALQKPRVRKSIDICQTLVEAGRVNFHAPADFRSGRKLEVCMHRILDVVIAQVLYHREMQRC